VLVSASASPALGDHVPLVQLGEVEEFFARVPVVNHCAYRHLQLNSFAMPTSFVRTFAMSTALRFVLWVESEMKEGIVVRAGNHRDIAATTAIATGGSTLGDELFATEGNDPVASIASFDPNADLVDKHNDLLRPGTNF
jgi:hypothetical protein